jgi:hypothetical protein
VKCLYCSQQIVFKPGKGWIHQEGGIYMMLCLNCGWLGAPSGKVTSCPVCGSHKVVDDHAAWPDRSEK